MQLSDRCNTGYYSVASSKTSKNSGKKGLSPKQERFVQEYLVDLNATKAAERAGYSKKTARVIGAENLTKPDIQAAIALALRQRESASKATVDRLERELERIALLDIRKVFRDDGSLKAPHEWDDETAGAIVSLEVIEQFEGQGEERRLSGFLKKIKCSDKRAAIVDLLKRRDVAQPPPPVPGSSPENPLHVAAVHTVAPSALRAFVASLEEAGLGDADIEGMEGILRDGDSEPVDPKGAVAKTG